MVFAQTSPPDVITTRLTLDEYRAMEETNPERHDAMERLLLCREARNLIVRRRVSVTSRREAACRETSLATS
ncbi:hypothetical protein [Nostoc sp. DedQUE09]|uniref:hypothetical protein n=1 Tax=Nostoc sp. DedQUE09 TaxID=3075394 RepID=UPI002AD2A052|nr:hypothetical protein [Nostoc sp. DedQUE09]MDZ7951070.1 hypothetical protein [Nostoc sp. DedQUE09]